MPIRSLRSLVAGQTPITVAKTVTVVEAARTMKQHNIGALLVVDGSRLCGIFTERDALFRVLAEGRDPGGDETERRHDAATADHSSGQAVPARAAHHAHRVGSGTCRSSRTDGRLAWCRRATRSTRTSTNCVPISTQREDMLE